MENGWRHLSGEAVQSLRQGHAEDDMTDRLTIPIPLRDIERATENGNTFFAQLAHQLLATMQREQKLREQLSKKDRELTCNRENVKRLKDKIKALQGRKKLPRAVDHHND